MRWPTATASSANLGRVAWPPSTSRTIKHDRDVAIKVLHPDLGAALGGERFLSEIRTTAQLQHPHILPLLDSGDADGLLYYVMLLVTGETLRARLERERQLPIAEAVRIAREVASALDYAHRQNVIHRDIKPENIVLHDGSALVADVGIALAVQSAGGQRMTQTGLSLGTPQYMSPEQAMGERTIDARSDIYALGAVTYEMLAGDAPFTGSSVQAIVAKVISSEPERLTVARKTAPPHVEAAVLTARSWARRARIERRRPDGQRRGRRREEEGLSIAWCRGRLVVWARTAGTETKRGEIVRLVSCVFASDHERKAVGEVHGDSGRNAMSLPELITSALITPAGNHSSCVSVTRSGMPRRTTWAVRASGSSTQYSATPASR
ncbi:hypothetical protein BH09GEM1_BH09GEM1_00110 [soil metagenome]